MPHQPSATAAPRSRTSPASRTTAPGTAAPLKPLRGVRILSLALNLPGPAALMRCQAMGARCVKLEPPPPASAPKGASGDPMGLYNPKAYREMHAGVRLVWADLKTERGQKLLHRELAKTDVLLTSFRPSALVKLGLDWPRLRRSYPQLSMVEIVGAPGARAEEPGHDLTYMAEQGLVPGLELPSSLFADMGGSLMASEAVLKARLLQLQKGKGVRFEIALNEAAGYLGLPQHWGLTRPGAAVGGGHAGYRVYPCKDGRVALAALEPHFAAALAREAGLPASQDAMRSMWDPETHAAVARFVAGKTCRALTALGAAQDIPLLALPG